MSTTIERKSMTEIVGECMGIDPESLANIEPSMIVSAFQFENGRRIKIWTSRGHIKTFECDGNWNEYAEPYAECPLEWSGLSAKEYHLKARNEWHKPESFIKDQSTEL